MRKPKQQQPSDTNSANNSFSNELNLSSSSKLTSNNSLNNDPISQDIYVGMKSFDILNTSERFYDLKKRTTNIIKVTSQPSTTASSSNSNNSYSNNSVAVKSTPPPNVQIDIKPETLEDSHILPVKFENDVITGTVAVDEVKQNEEHEECATSPQSVVVTEPNHHEQTNKVTQVRPIK